MNLSVDGEEDGSTYKRRAKPSVQVNNNNNNEKKRLDHRKQMLVSRKSMRGAVKGKAKRNSAEKRDTSIRSGRLSFRGDPNKKDRSSRRVLRNANASTMNAANDTKIRQVYEKMRKKVDSIKGARNYRNEEGIRCPDEISQHVDVPDEYGAEVSAFEEPFVVNNENNGNLFVNSVPFWVLKTEKLPPQKIVPTTTTLRDIVDGKLKLVRADDAKYFDEYAPIECLVSKDAVYFNKPNLVLSNTIRSIVSMNDVHGPKKEEDSALFPHVNEPKVINIRPPEIQYIYNRKNRHDIMAKIPFIPGQARKKKKKWIFM